MRAIVRRAESFGGVATVPGDKSVSHRAVLLAGMATGTTRMRNVAPGADVRASLEIVRRLGARVSTSADRVEIVSDGVASWRRDVGALDAANSGTTARLLLGILAGVDGLEATLVGDASLSRRPMKRVVEPLSRMGARVELSAGALPARIAGTRLAGVDHVLPIASAQVKSALLLAGLNADGETWVREPSPSRDHTERMLPSFGATVLRSSRGTGVRSATLVAPSTELALPGDPSSAAFLAVAAALVPGGAVRLESVGLNPTRAAVFEVLARIGADVVVRDRVEVDGEPVGVVEIRQRALKGTTIEGDEIPRLLDELPLLAIAAAGAEGETIIRDAAELRVKESDRIDVVVRGLRAMGGDIEERPDGLVVRGGRPLRGATIDAGADHRIAMAFAVAGLVADGATSIEEAEWADVSWPGFFDVLARMSGGAVHLE